MVKDGRTYCDAGRSAFFAGRWPLPCPADIEAAGRIHVIYEPGGLRLELCDEHFDEVNRLGLVTDPYAGRDFIAEQLGRRPEDL